jgi:hypothetical protein
MANDCSNKVRITGKKENLEKLYERFQMDEKKEKNALFTSSYGIMFESSKEVEEWGSKWQTFNDISFDGESSISIEGDSAWVPATGFWQKVSEEFNVNLEIEYSEPGCNLAGEIAYESGEETKNNEMTYWEFIYEKENDYFWEEIGYRSEYSALDEITEELGDVYSGMSDEEKNRLAEIHEKNYQE